LFRLERLGAKASNREPMKMRIRTFKEEPARIVRHQQNDEQGNRQMTEVEIFTPDAL